MKTSSVYYKAAELIASKKQDYCCPALDFFGKNKEDFKTYFKPRKKETNGCSSIVLHLWFGFRGDSSNQLARTLALLLMAEMESRGEL